MYFLFSKAGKFKTSMARVPYNKLLTNLASSSRTGEYWPSVVFVRTSLRSVRTATTSGQYSPVRPSRSVSKRLIYLLYGKLTVHAQNGNSNYNVSSRSPNFTIRSHNMRTDSAVASNRPTEALASVISFTFVVYSHYKHS